MAEIVGLAFGTITLVTLFNTCVEFLDYYEDAKNLTEDINIAATKVGFLRLRFHRWGEELAIDHPGPNEEALMQRWPADSDVILEGLAQITEILGNTMLLICRYQSNAKVFRPIISECVGNTCTQKELSFYRLMPHAKAKSAYKNPPASPTPRKVFTFCQRIKWAVQDRKKFDLLIANLDFLIRSLENLHSSSTKGSIQASSVSGSSNLGMPGDEDHDRGKHGQPRVKRLANTSAKRSDSDISSRETMPLSSPTPQMGGGSADAPLGSSTSSNVTPDLAASLASPRHQHVYVKQSFDKKSRSIQGNGVGAAAREGERGNIYLETTATEGSAVFSGNVTDQQLSNFFHGP